MSGPRVRKFYERERVFAREGKDGRTHQSEADRCDIKKILKRYNELGVPIMGTQRRQPVYGDFSNVDDYKNALDTVMAAQDRFYELPSEIRDLGGNDVERFMERCQDPAFVEDVQKTLGDAFMAEVSAEAPEPEKSETSAEVPETSQEGPVGS